jgi:hypothetical protein
MVQNCRHEIRNRARLEGLVRRGIRANRGDCHLGDELMKKHLPTIWLVVMLLAGALAAIWLHRTDHNNTEPSRQSNSPPNGIYTITASNGFMLVYYISMNGQSNYSFTCDHVILRFEFP